MSADQLRLFVERIERLMAERTAISEDIRDVYAEAKSTGYDTATIRKLIARRAMNPQDRREADAQLATYEVALGLEAADSLPPLTERRPDAAAIALELLTAEIVMLEDQQQAAALVEHITVLLDLRAEVAVLRLQERERRALARTEGFDANQLALTVRWYEKCVKHGVEAMRLGEETFNLYRGTFDGFEAQSGMSERDRELLAKFAGGDPVKPKPTKAKRTRLDAIALARLSSQARDV